STVDHLADRDSCMALTPAAGSDRRFSRSGFGARARDRSTIDCGPRHAGCDGGGGAETPDRCRHGGGGCASRSDARHRSRIVVAARRARLVSVLSGPDVATRRQAFVDGLFFRVVACSFLEVVLLITAISSGLPLLTFLPGAIVIAV